MSPIPNLIDRRRTVETLVGTVEVHVSSSSLAEEGHSGGRDRTMTPWWPSQPWFPHLNRLCVDQLRVLLYR